MDQKHAAALAKRYRQKPCAVCGKTINAYAQQYRCKPCQTAANAHKIKANRIVEVAVAKGRLLREGCEALHKGERCNRIPTHAHHEDYSKPLEVVWLCPLHHSWRHDEMRRWGTDQYQVRLTAIAKATTRTMTAQVEAKNANLS